MPLCRPTGFIISQVLKTFLLSDTLTETFDAVLLERGLDSLVAKGREVPQQSAGSKGGKSLGKLLTKPLNKFKPEAIIKYLMTIPLNGALSVLALFRLPACRVTDPRPLSTSPSAIPIVGTVVFFAINGTQQGPNQMARYHELKQLSPESRKKFISAHRGAYSALGVVSLLLTLVPVVGPVVFTYTNEVGAALLAADLEKREGKIVEGERAIKGGAKKDL